MKRPKMMLVHLLKTGKNEQKPLETAGEALFFRSIVGHSDVKSPTFASNTNTTGEGIWQEQSLT